MIQYFSIILFVLGIYGLLTQKNLVKMVVSLNIMDVGINLFIISLGYVDGGKAPILSPWTPESTLNFVDPLPQALVLTAIVIGVGITALALSLIIKIHRTYGSVDLDEIRGNVK
ncbi:MULTISPECIES: sodium:proton antiporter [Kosmotoga]|jgi:multicomponent Na+:H+ antiporter subunit C|uniref:NADH-ubiquinone oxidoreductase chain 4L n=1 Tax=Kosmotoga olearia (strain ATCC BAA-1733 / DSM 21960 / TBF 19.5.1) TaxID=521045 RepID=C5CHR0_KOSOT|nr:MULTISPECIES: cation:proton antiporter subunit C [Kosmotoga]ACR80736.1 NADH-ubiquinone oxidoreductase chain 4L [Kosmotoga olearia TBF 19.5.1]MDK2954214.1 multicomponent Na+:H+ antiporter subunit [Kosmotoga sp.]OAA19182.1 monovalent cation/H+ antiporter subunit C [Kosmotoga sp. DU53]